MYNCRAPSLNKNFQENSYFDTDYLSCDLRATKDWGKKKKKLSLTSMRLLVLWNPSMWYRWSWSHMRRNKNTKLVIWGRNLVLLTHCRSIAWGCLLPREHLTNYYVIVSLGFSLRHNKTHHYRVCVRVRARPPIICLFTRNTIEGMGGFSLNLEWMPFYWGLPDASIFQLPTTN